VAVAAAVWFPAGQAFAHAELEATVPAANAVLDTSPPAIVLDFDEAVDAGLSTIELYDQSAQLVAIGRPAAGDDTTTVQSSVPTLADGVYVVVWRVASYDGHVVDGVFSFTVGPARLFDVGALIDRVSGDAAATSTVGRLETAARLLGTIGLVVLLGGGLLALQVADVGANRMLLRMAWAFLLIGALGQFGMYGAKVVAGTPSDALDPSVWDKVADSHTGGILMIRVLLVVVSSALLRTWPHRNRRLWRGSAVVMTLGIITTFATIGHAYTQHPAALWVAIDALHLVAIAVWIGGLLMLAFGTSSWLVDADTEVVVRRFSTSAMVAVPVIVATGAAQTLRLADLDDVSQTSWGRLLLVKVAAVTVLIAIGGVSQWLLRNDGPSSVRRNVLVEALIGVGVIGLAAALIALPPNG
jgi:copper transport protein